MDQPAPKVSSCSGVARRIVAEWWFVWAILVSRLRAKIDRLHVRPGWSGLPSYELEGKTIIGGKNELVTPLIHKV